VRELAPKALVINLTNPAGMVQQAATTEFGLRVISICDSPFTVTEAVAGRLGWDTAHARRRYLGMNHFGWCVPESPQQVAAAADLVAGVDPAAVVLHQAVPNAYVRYYVHPERILESQRGRPTRAQELLGLEEELLRGYQRGEVPASPRRGAVWYSQALLPVLDAWLNGAADPLIVGISNQGRLSHLPPEVVLEAPAVFRKPGEMTVLPLPELPRLPATLLAHHAAYEDLTVGAVLEGGSSEALTRALMANPMVHSYEEASGLLGLILAREGRAA
jgi:6-phospho-beta-glucosidase